MLICCAAEGGIEIRRPGKFQNISVNLMRGLRCLWILDIVRGAAVCSLRFSWKLLIFTGEFLNRSSRDRENAGVGKRFILKQHESNTLFMRKI